MKQTVKLVLVRTAWMIGIFVALSALASFSGRLEARKEGAYRLRAALFINGTLGDKSFFDSAAHGMQEVRRTLPVAVRVIEGGTDPTRWESSLADLADSGDYDVIVVGTFTMVPYVQKLAGQFPHARFIVFDAAVDYRHCNCRNVHSILFRQNEGAYLAGYLAAMLVRDGLPGISRDSSLGVVGGMQFPVIEDYLIGFGAGAQAAAPGIRVASQYANGFSDPAAGKEIARAQMAQGAAVVFHAAGASGQGVNEAASEAHRYAIGVDLDQYALYQRSNPTKAAAIITSVLKNVDVAIVHAIGLHLQGKLAYGSTESLGLAENGVSLARHSAVLESQPATRMEQIDKVRQEIVAGRIRVPSAFARSPDPAAATT
ncbi:BMP family protein [Herbaspirillum sp. RV1423]|uniref:BMP family lipoprotein n=1 Tax=Herbaspirillum sp. RV1423 TaxID=1443993 RepID=UPI0004AF47BA|nr:BMP family ABC transporter substrate-binding protein [Herbaspirillum sp. RV1423]